LKYNSNKKTKSLIILGPHTFPISYKQEDNVIIATVPALPGCVSYGYTLDEAERNIQEAIACHIESMIEDGEPLPR